MFPGKNELFNEKGAFTIYMAAMLSLVIIISAPLFIKTHLISVKRSISHTNELKAAMTARSGIWYGLEQLHAFLDRDTLISDTLPHFGDEDFQKKPLDASQSSFLSGDTLEISPFDSIDQGLFRLSSRVRGAFLELYSQGNFLEEDVSVKAGFATLLFKTPDTVLCVKTGSRPQGSGFVNGKTVLLKEAPDALVKRFSISKREFERSISEYRDILSALETESLPGPPVNVFSSSDLKSVPDTVKSSLFIDGMSEDIKGKLPSETFVLEDVQITGDVVLENSKIICAGDVKILDKAELVNCEIFTASRFFISGEAHYSGCCTAMGDIEIFENAVIEDKSTFISAGKAEREKKEGRKPFSLFIRDNVTADGVFIDLRKNAGIYSSQASIINGILWSAGNVRHNGVVHGAVYAGRLTSEAMEDTVKNNFLDGEIDGLDEIGEYVLPYYIGRPELLSLREE